MGRTYFGIVVQALALLSFGVSGRQLLQQQGGVSFPGCTFFSDSVVATNPDFSTLKTALQAVGLDETLSSLTTPYTLFAPTNEAFADYNEAAGITTSEGAVSPHLLAGIELLIVPEAVLDTSDFEDGEVLHTLYSNGNLTVLTDEVNGTESVFIVSPASEASIITPPQYACNLVIYGVDAAFVPVENILDSESPGSIHNITEYLNQLFVPGGAEVTIGAVIAAVAAGDVAEVAAAFDVAVQNSYTEQLVALLEQAVGVPNGVATLAAVGNEMIAQAGCGSVRPIIQQLYPTSYSTPQSLGVSPDELRSIPEADPRLASCATTGV